MCIPPLSRMKKWNGWPSADRLGDAINAWVRQVGIAVACLTILGVAIRAASSISGEREQETFESLVASPVGITQICFAKWLGSLWSMRWGFLWLCLVWMLGILTGGLNFVVLPWLVLCWLVYASFFASLGLWFSARTSKTLPATVWTLSATVAISVGQLLPWLLFGMPAIYSRAAWNLQLSTLALRDLELFQVYGMTPPLAFGWLSFRQTNFNFFMSSDYDAFAILQTIAAGLLVWLMGARFLWVRACRRLEWERIDAHDRPRMLDLGSEVSAELWAKTVSQSQV
jgi:ABC-type transport system involved in multi-copper enzyme maturation permease subunit